MRLHGLARAGISDGEGGNDSRRFRNSRGDGRLGRECHGRGVASRSRDALSLRKKFTLGRTLGTDEFRHPVRPRFAGLRAVERLPISGGLQPVICSQVHNDAVGVNSFDRGSDVRRSSVRKSQNGDVGIGQNRWVSGLNFPVSQTSQMRVIITQGPPRGSRT